MVISILGCGWYGKALAKALLKENITVNGSATSADKLEHLQALGVQPFFIKFEADSEIIDPEFFKCNILVISIPPRLKAGEGESYLFKIQSVIETLIQYRVKKVIYISSTGVYGDHNNEVNELCEPNPDTSSGTILLDAEKLFQKDDAFKTTIIRFGGLVGPGRHPGRFFSGKTGIPNGLAPVNLVHQLDSVAITTAVIGQDAFGHLFNAVSPDHPAKSEYYRRMSVEANLPIPAFINELKRWKIVNSINLADILKYQFIIDNWVKYPTDLYNK